MSADGLLGVKKEERCLTSPKVLVRGSGSMGSRYLHLLRDELRVPVLAYPKRTSRADELGNQGFQTIQDLEELRRDGTLHSIVATNTGEHLEDAESLTQLGKVLIEKPLAPSLNDLDDFRKKMGPATKSISVAFCWRFSLGANFVKERLPSLGQLYHVRIECSSFLPEWRPGTVYTESYSASEREGGVLRDLAHEIDYATWLFGYPEKVCGLLSNNGHLGIRSEESADILWVAPGGATVSLRLDYLSRRPVRFLKVSGERGVITWDLLESTVLIEMEDGSEETHQFLDERNLMLVRQLKDFLGSTGDASLLASFQEGVRVVALSEAARKSSFSQSWEVVPDFEMG